jgi:sRNA-binding protein
MASSHTIERQRGIKEAGQQLGVLRERWPLAFPLQAQDVRPLALGIAGQIAAAMGWSLPYTLSVLRHWKMAAVYCRAVLAHDLRIALDGAPAEGVDPGAKELAAKQLARIEARNAAKKKATPPAKPKSALHPSRRHK